MTVRESLKRIPFLKKIIGKIRKIKLVLQNLNYIKTIYVNFRTQKFKDAIKLPIFVYGRLQVGSLRGKIILTSPVKCRMVIFGKSMDGFSPKTKSLLSVSGELHMAGYNIFSTGFVLDVSGVCSLGLGSGGGSCTVLRCLDKITIGNFTRFGAWTTIIDTNFHFTRNIHTGVVARSSDEIILGNFCWLGLKSNIMKGTIIPDHTIVAGNSLLNKDYTIDAPLAPMIAGIPAKIITHGYVRIRNNDIEMELTKYFRANPLKTKIDYTVGLIDETNDVINHLKTL